MKINKKNMGFTLIEIIISIAILSIVTTGVFAFLSTGVRLNNITFERYSVQNDVRKAVKSISEPLKYAVNLKILSNVKDSIIMSDHFGYNVIFYDSDSKSIKHYLFDKDSMSYDKLIILQPENSAIYTLNFNNLLNGKILTFNLLNSSENYEISSNVELLNFGLGINDLTNSGDGIRYRYFEPDNDAPTAYPVTISGIPKENQDLIGSYTYYDIDNDIEGTSVFKWYRSANNDGSNLTPIDGANSQIYTLTFSDINNYIYFEVTPVAVTGNTTGTPTLSPSTLKIVSSTTNSAPAITEAEIEGEAKRNKKVTGSYQYYDPDGDEEGISTFQWYYSENIGETKIPITSANSTDFTIPADIAYRDRYLYFEVTPVDIYSDSGLPFMSNPYGPIS